jgi:hypothetical protein
MGRWILRDEPTAVWRKAATDRGERDVVGCMKVIRVERIEGEMRKKWERNGERNFVESWLVVCCSVMVLKGGWRWRRWWVWWACPAKSELISSREPFLVHQANELILP